MLFHIRALESFRANTVDAPAAYVAISRAKAHTSIYTDNRASLTRAIGSRNGVQVGALDHDLTRYGPGTVLDGPGSKVGIALNHTIAIGA